MATKSQNAIISVSTAALAAKTITGATAANPVVVTSTAHGLANGAVVVIKDVVGMTQLNGRAFIVANQATNTFELKGVDGTGYTAYTSGGSATPQTMTEIAEIAAVPSIFDGQSSEIDTTNLRSTAKEFMLGMQDFGGGQFELFMKNTDVGQTKMRSLKGNAVVGTFTIILSNSEVAAFQAYVKQFSLNGLSPDGVLKATASLRMTGEPAWFA